MENDCCKLYLAGPGAGKTTFLVERAAELASHGSRILFTTFTRSNMGAIEASFGERYGVIPAGVTLLTWFSFLLRDGVRPFGFSAIPERIDELHLDSGGPGYGRRKKGSHNYYCLTRGVIHSGRLAELTIDCDAEHDGDVIRRIAAIYDYVFIDEAQDLNGYDYEIAFKLLKAGVKLIAVGDLRQCTYRTAYAQKNKGYASLFDYLSEKCGFVIDDTTLCRSYRCCQPLLDLADALYEGVYPPTYSFVSDNSAHTGVYLVEETDLGEYLDSFNPVPLWYKASRKHAELNAMNMGISKGLTFDRVLIVPTNDFVKWLIDRRVDLSADVRAKTYVAITRARYSAAILVPDGYHEKCPLIHWWTGLETVSL